MRHDTSGPPEEKTPISMLLVDDHPVCREGIRSMLGDSEFQIVAEAQTSREALELAQRMNPNLIVLEIRIAGGDGLDLLTALKARQPEVPVVVLTTYEHPVYVARAVASGASAYLLKGTDTESLLQSLRAVCRGEILFGPEELTQWLRRVSRDITGAHDLIRPLTHREMDVLRMLGAGLSNREIARVLFVAESTVKTHIEHIVRKLGVSDRTQAAVWAARQRVGSGA